MAILDGSNLIQKRPRTIRVSNKFTRVCRPLHNTPPDSTQTNQLRDSLTTWVLYDAHYQCICFLNYKTESMDYFVLLETS